MTSGCENKEIYCKQCHSESHVRKLDDEVILCLCNAYRIILILCSCHKVLYFMTQRKMNKCESRQTKKSFYPKKKKYTL